MFTICELQQNIVTCSGTCEQCSLSILPFPSSHWKPEILSKLPSETSHTGAPHHFIFRNILFMDFYCAKNLMGLIWHHVKNHVENDLAQIWNWVSHRKQRGGWEDSSITSFFIQLPTNSFTLRWVQNIKTWTLFLKIWPPFPDGGIHHLC